MSAVAGSLAPGLPGVEFEMIKVDGIPAAWLVPGAAKDENVILYLHGGAYVTGSIRSHRKMLGWIARSARCRALIIDYRLAPENTFPAALDDSMCAYKWLLSQGYKPGNIVIAGDSAGGGLAVSMVVKLRDTGFPLPAAVIALSPWTDLAMTGDSLEANRRKDPLLHLAWLKACAGMYQGQAETGDPLISPLYADLKGLPPMLIHAGSKEILLDDSVRLVDRARQEGVEVELEIWEGLYHVFQLLCPLTPESRDSVHKLAGYFNKKVSA